MEIIYCDERADRPAESYRLVLLTGGWHIVANGYLCKVNTIEEGRRVLATLCPASLQEQPPIDTA